MVNLDPVLLARMVACMQLEQHAPQQGTHVPNKSFSALITHC